MRWLGILVVAGCGRFGFDAAPEATDAGPPADCVGPDEDADGWPDACDNCLTVANPMQDDAGEIAVGAAADGIGDACDPRPASAADRILFAALHGGDPFVGYDAMYGAIAAPGNGALRIGALDDAGSAVFVFQGVVTRVDCTYTVVASSDQLQWFGVWTDDTDQDALFLEGAWELGAPSAVFRIKEDLVGSERLSSEIVGPSRFTSGARFQILSDTEIVTGTEQRMTIVDRTTGVSASTSLAIQIPRFAKGYLEANRAIVDFEYLVIYGE